MSGYRVIERAGRDALGEGLYWSARRNAVFWTDITGKRIHRLTLTDESVASWELPDTPGWVVERRASEGFLAGLGDHIAMLSLDPLRIEPIIAPEGAATGMRMNDALVDREGRLWAGTVVRSCDQPVGALYRLDADMVLTRMDSGYTVTNGPAISPDGQWFYHADSPLGLVYRYGLDPQGQLAERSVFVRFAPDWGYPDGMACDAEGGLWVAHWGGGCVSRFAPDGTRDTVIVLPASQITNVTFAGAALDRMFVTSAADGVDEVLGGALFEVRPGYCGLPTYGFGG